MPSSVLLSPAFASHLRFSTFIHRLRRTTSIHAVDHQATRSHWDSLSSCQACRAGTCPARSITNLQRSTFPEHPRQCVRSPPDTPSPSPPPETLEDTTFRVWNVDPVPKVRKPRSDPLISCVQESPYVCSSSERARLLESFCPEHKNCQASFDCATAT